jgi:hypothetical protein
VSFGQPNFPEVLCFTPNGRSGVDPVPMRVDCGQFDPSAVIRPELGEWHPRMPEHLDEEELADWRAGRNAVYQLAALTVGARLAVADA